jgi:hypothetical protein
LLVHFVFFQLFPEREPGDMDVSWLAAVMGGAAVTEEEG